ncbi:glutamate 5-kinase [soil metagenome]
MAKGNGEARRESSARGGIARAARVVVKIGSSSLASAGAIERLASSIAALRQDKKSVVLVSSGAISLGYKKLGYKTRPTEVAKLQAAAAAGQSLLMRTYEEAFGAHSLSVAQVLLTHSDVSERARANNARAALDEILAAGAIPILNENDSVAVEEIKFGDNDQLAAMVTPLVDGELLILLSDVEGVLDHGGARVPEVRDVEEIRPFLRKSKSNVGTGGMDSKIEAARRAALAGAHVVIGDARVPGLVEDIARGADVGTHFLPAAERMSARKYWIAFTLRPRGDVILDAGAVAAVQGKKKSVLGVGVLGIRGDFRTGDAVRLLDGAANEIGRGLSGMSSVDAARMAGRPLDEDDKEKGVLVHRDELVVWPAR